MAVHTFVALDIETTGLDLQNDHLLEVHAKLLDAHSLVVRGEFNGLVHYDEAPRMNDFCRRMHTETGLLRAITSGDGQPLERVLDQLAAFLGGCGERYHLMGRNVGTFDRVLLERLRPGLFARSTHQNFDMSTLLNFFDLFADSRPHFDGFKGTAHRARDDVANDIHQLEVLSELAGSW